MRRYWALLLFVFICFIVSCSKDDESTDNTNKGNTPTTEEQDRYYVRYDVNVYSGAQISFKLNISYSDDKGNKKISFEEYGRRKTWDGTYGPFKKNDHVLLNCSVSHEMEISASISVSRNEEPFVKKAELIKTDKKCSLDYTIDF